jgi:hypothetical protein
MEPGAEEDRTKEFALSDLSSQLSPPGDLATVEIRQGSLKSRSGSFIDLDPESQPEQEARILAALGYSPNFTP